MMFNGFLRDDHYDDGLHDDVYARDGVHDCHARDVLFD